MIEEETKMKTLAAIALAAATALSLGACASGPYQGGPYAYGYVDGYYDDYYGPFYDGYWGPDAAFYYRANVHDTFHRDDAGHFHRAAGQGGHSFHARAARAPG
jgi:hypothetical protein